jgi:hypothetical protein
MPWSDDMRCLHCDGKLPLYRKLTSGQFCSAGHRKAYWEEQERLAVERLHQTHDSLLAYRASLPQEPIAKIPPPSEPLADEPIYVTASAPVRDWESASSAPEMARTASNRGMVKVGEFLTEAKPAPHPGALVWPAEIDLAPWPGDGLSIPPCDAAALNGVLGVAGSVPMVAFSLADAVSSVRIHAGHNTALLFTPGSPHISFSTALDTPEFEQGYVALPSVDAEPEQPDRKSVV